MSTICIFSAFFPPNMGGVEHFTDSLAAELVKEGHSVVVVTNNTHGLADREILESGAEVLRLPCICILNGRYPIPVPNRCCRQLLQYLKSIVFDGVLVNTRFYIHSVIGVHLAEGQGLRAIVLDHGSAYLTLGSKFIDWVIARYEDVMSSYLKRCRVDFYGISKKSVEWLSHFGIEAKGIIGNSIDAAAYRRKASNRDFRGEASIPSDDMLVVFAGRLVPEKGVGVLIDAMSEVSDKPISLIVAGDGPMRSVVLKSRNPRVRWVGKLDQADIVAMLICADVFCLPSRSEGFSTSLLEASACGIPSIVTPVGGAEELIPSPAFGFILKNSSVEELVSELLEALRKKEMLAEMGFKCQRLVENDYSWTNAAQALLNAFVSAVVTS